MDGDEAVAEVTIKENDHNAISMVCWDTNKQNAINYMVILTKRSNKGR
jgi:hypothetical protein